MYVPQGLAYRIEWVPSLNYLPIKGKDGRDHICKEYLAQMYAKLIRLGEDMTWMGCVVKGNN
jgi:hypothetical protein